MWSRGHRGKSQGYPAIPRVLLATSSTSPSSLPPLPRISRGLPGEGKLYDAITLHNFVDLEKRNLTASISKSFRSDALSTLLGADFPAKITVGGKLGNAWHNGVTFNPLGKLALAVQLLDLSSPDSRQAGFLKFKAATRTNGRADHGFEIDRKVSVFNFRDTSLYGNVRYGTNNRANGIWKTHSSFGLHQTVRFAGVKFGALIGMTPEGAVVTDIKF